MKNSELGNIMLSESKFYMGYSRWDEIKNGYETWEESVERVMRMHRDKYSDRLTPELLSYMDEAEQAYKDQLILGAQRALQFGGEQLRKHEARMYNCSVSHCDRPDFFNEAMYLLLCGCGVGFSVQKHHVDKIPAITKRTKKTLKVFTVPDDIEGWADAFAVMLSSYLIIGGKFPEYHGHIVHFDYSLIRPKGSMISGGFKAPGPDGLRAALEKWERLLNSQFSEVHTIKIRPIVAYDLVMHMSDAVLSGGVRRSATICLFDKFDTEMLNAKTGNWFVENPQRGRSNNSVMLKRDELTREEWAGIMKSVKEFGEPGFIFTDDLEFCYNPCVEIGMLPVTEDGESGFQFCCLSEGNGGKIVSKELLMQAARAGSIIGTLQAGYTDFKYLSPASKKITEREALIGVSITGWMNNPDVLFNEQDLEEAAKEVLRVNKIVAKLLGINPAARGTCVKPSGNASVRLRCASGIHGEHSDIYFRNVQMQDDDEVLQLIKSVNPKMVEKSVWSSSGNNYVVSFPVVTKPGSIVKENLMGIKQLEFVKKAQKHWVNAGTDLDLCVDKKLRHNVSNTISVDNWEEVEQYIFDNKEWFAGISLMPAAGDKAYAQAPFTEVLTGDQILAKYGEASFFASGLIVDALHAFNNNLWLACDTARGFGEKLSEDSDDLLKRDWVRRAIKFADMYFNSDLELMTFCLKDCYNLHKWESIQKTMKFIDFSKELTRQSYVEVDTMGSQGCAGGACEVSF